MIDLSSEDPRISDLLDSLDTELRLVDVSDRTFVDERVYLDGRWFTRCVFTRCELVSRLGAWRMAECQLIDHKGLILNGPSARLYELIRQNSEAGGELSLAIDGYRGSDPGARA